MSREKRKGAHTRGGGGTLNSQEIGLQRTKGVGEGGGQGAKSEGLLPRRSTNEPDSEP